MTFDDASAAASPARFAISRRRFVRYFGRNAAHRLVLWLVVTLPGPILAEWREFRRIPWLGPAMYCWAHMRELLAGGALTPVVVVDAARGLCAAYSSLGATDDHTTPVVKIFAQALRHAGPGVRDGHRFVAASGFCQPAADRPDDWSDFSPQIVDTLCEDGAACIQARRRIAQFAWDELQAAVAELGPRARQPGLYHLDPARYVAWAADDVYVR